MIFIEFEKSLQKVLLGHELLGCEPPVIFLLFGIVLLGSTLYLSLTHHADGLKHFLDWVRWFAEHLDFVNVLTLDRIQCLDGSSQDRQSFSEVIIALLFDCLGFQSYLIGSCLFLLNLSLLGLNYFD